MGAWKHTPLKKKKFVDTLAKSGNISFAARASGLSPRHYYNLRRTDPGFDADCAVALETAMDRLEEEAWRRAVDGEEEYVVSAGRLVLGPDKTPLKRRRKSDKMLILLLRAHNRKFRDGPEPLAPGPVDTTAARQRLRQLGERHERATKSAD
jgi:hypothetical protein